MAERKRVETFGTRRLASAGRSSWMARAVEAGGGDPSRRKVTSAPSAYRSVQGP